MIKILQNLISRIVNFLVDRSFIKRKTKGKNIEKIIDLYSKVEYTRGFVKFRFWFGPLHEINKLTPKTGTILDIGSGEGILANFLAINFPKRKIIGVEINKNRVKEARKGLKNTKFITGSVFDVKLPKVNTIIVSHVFHHLGSYDLQEKMIALIYKKLNKNGKLIIAEVDKEFSLKYLFGWIADVLPIAIFFEKKLLDLTIRHRSKSDWIKLLEKYGFKIIYLKNTKDRIYPEVIIIATK